jgi:starch synthase (maltosyl-transferring)
MGFDTLYFPPIHPIGLSNRKGKNNTLDADADQPGSPYAIGSPTGGHSAIHPDLGTLADFDRLVTAARAHGLEIALDFAIQCSPDHPWLKEHPDWFSRRADGSMRYAENPPKKYQDIVNVDFYSAQATPAHQMALWGALRDVVLFWAERGVRAFRVDNPHTKPLPFWEWMIAEVQARFPDALFLSEAFTRPKMMYRLAKVGFSQSYTYFTWREDKAGLSAYLQELNALPAADSFRPHFFVNTPDINPYFLQRSGRAGHLIRMALAATTSGLWGMYSGFELCEATALPGKEEYLNSEKFEIRAWDWRRPGNIIAEMTALNGLRRRNPALQSHLGLQLLSAHNDQILCFVKATAARDNLIVVAISLDPFQAQSAAIEAPFWLLDQPDDGVVAITDLVHGNAGIWRGKHQWVHLTPDQPYAIWRLDSAA